MISYSFVKDYLRHRITGKKHHAVTSPFVHQLLKQIIDDRIADPVYAQIEGTKRGLLPNSRRKGNRPKVDQLLYRIARFIEPATIVELGTGMGISQLYLAKAAPQALLKSLEPEGALKHVVAKLPQIDLAFINYYAPEDLYGYFETLLPKLGKHSILAISNVYNSNLTKQHWQTIKDHKEVSTTVDLFWVQVAMFQGGISGEHLKVKF